MFGELVMISTLFIVLASGCGKKKGGGEAAKLKPRELDAQGKPVSGEKPGEGAKSTVDKPAAASMTPREADDNETINDAKSDWGSIPK
ncbi:unnamed protein product [Caenorhabditis sp. 36 PRJEB53466]|nr:unnamed protein product [Caenorhabditis sp. 36 PRJEB53466]